MGTVLPFLSELIDLATGIEQNFPMPLVHCMYSELAMKMEWHAMCNTKRERYLLDLDRHVGTFKQLS